MNKTLVKRLTVWAGIVAGILMIPFIGKFPWTAFDYVVGTVVLFGAATFYELVTQNMKNRTHRIVVGIFTALIVVALWAFAVAG